MSFPSLRQLVVEMNFSKIALSKTIELIKNSINSGKMSSIKMGYVPEIIDLMMQDIPELSNNLNNAKNLLIYMDRIGLIELRPDSGILSNIDKKFSINGPENSFLSIVRLKNT